MRSQKIPIVNEIIKYHLPKSEEWTHAKVISRRGKSTGRNKYVKVMNEKDKYWEYI